MRKKIARSNRTIKKAGIIISVLFIKIICKHLWTELAKVDSMEHYTNGAFLKKEN
jgi:hypothetical protein